MVHVSDVRLKLVHQACSNPRNCRAAIAVLVAARSAECVVDPCNGQAVALLGSHLVFGAIGPALARQHVHVITMEVHEHSRVLLGVDLRASLSGGRKPVRHDQDTHQMRAKRIGSQPLEAESPPRYWPSGQATARASACIARLADRPCDGFLPLPADVRARAACDRARQNSRRRNRAEPEQLKEPPVQQIGAGELVPRGALVRVHDHRVGHEVELMARQERRLPPLEIFSDRRLGERYLLPRGPSNAGAHVVECAQAKLRHRFEAIEIARCREPDAPR